MEPLPWVCVTRHPGSVQSVESGICHGVWLFQNNGRIVGKREGQGGIRPELSSQASGLLPLV